MNTEKYLILDWVSFFDLMNSSFGFSFKSIDDLINKIEHNNGKINWFSLRDWEKLDDIDIYKILENLAKPEGDVFVVTDVSYLTKTGPFKLHNIDFPVFVNEYRKEFMESFFNGDVLIFNIVNKLIWIFHHEGTYTLVRLNS